MRRLPRWFLLSLLMVPVALSGCAAKDDDEQPPPEPIVKKKIIEGDKEPLKGDTWDGIIRGTVVLEGDEPMMQIIPGVMDHSDKGCNIGANDMEKKQQTWIVGKNKGVANVLVYLKPPSGKYFVLKEEDKARKDKVEMDQPHCAYLPHVTVVFPSFLEPKEKDKPALVSRPSGQQFIVKNSAKFNHNVNWAGDPALNAPSNRLLNSEQEIKINLTPQKDPINFRCDIHNWMTAKVWAFDHPYAAVTKEDGTFEIKNVPTGVELPLYVWHEAGYSPKDGTKMKFQPGENKVDLSVRAK